MELALLWDVVKTAKQWLEKFFAKKAAAKPTSALSVAKRFVELFEAHGVKQSQIPNFFGHGLELKDFVDHNSLISVLSEQILSDAAELFAIRREWLDGVDEQIYKTHDFYKHPEDFVTFISDLKGNDGNLGGMLYVSQEDSRNAEAFFIIEECIGHIGDKPIYRNYFCGDWVYSYWRCRAYLAACIAIAWENRVYIHGQYITKELAKKLSGGYGFFGIDEWHGGYPSFRGERFDPEYMALNPEVYLDGIDEGLFGLKAALGLWLELEEQGYMKIGIGPSDRKPFENELKRLQKGNKHSTKRSLMNFFKSSN